MGFISLHVTPLVINSLGVDTHTDTHRHTQTQTQTQTQTHIHTHTYTHMYTHIQTSAQKQFSETRCMPATGWHAPGLKSH